MVTLSQPAMLRLYLQEKPWPFPVVADPERQAYRQFGLARTTWATFFRLGVLARYMGYIFRGWKPRATNTGEDLLQLGGDFVLDAGQHIVYAFSSTEPTDRPPVNQLVEKLQAVTATQNPGPSL